MTEDPRRRHGRLPSDVVFVRETPEFAEDQVPPGLLAAHQVAVGVWGLLRVHRGVVRFVDEADGVAQDVGSGEELVIAPERAHHVEPGPGSRMSVAFFR